MEENEKTSDNAADVKQSILSDEDFEKHGFKCVQVCDSGVKYYEKLIENVDHQITYKPGRETINLIMVNRHPLPESTYGNHQFRDFIVKESKDLDFMLERCYIYQMLITG